MWACFCANPPWLVCSQSGNQRPAFRKLQKLKTQMCVDRYEDMQNKLKHESHPAKMSRWGIQDREIILPCISQTYVHSLYSDIHTHTHPEDKHLYIDSYTSITGMTKQKSLHFQRKSFRACRHLVIPQLYLRGRFKHCKRRHTTRWHAGPSQRSANKILKQSWACEWRALHRWLNSTGHQLLWRKKNEH